MVHSVNFWADIASRNWKYTGGSTMKGARHMPSDQLPTIGDVLSHVAYLRNKEPSLTNCALAWTTADTIHGIWQRSEIPIIAIKSLKNSVTRLMNRRTPKNCKPTKNGLNERNHSELFLITKCRCDFFAIFDGKSDCSCKKEDKVSCSALPFLIDQLKNDNGRKMHLDSLSFTRKRKKKQKKKLRCVILSVT